MEKLKLNNGEYYHFKYKIKDVIEYNDFWIVILGVPMNTIFNENLFAISKDGKELWQFPKIDRVREDSPIVGYSLMDNKKEIRVNDWCGEYFEINIYNGQVLRSTRTEVGGGKLW